MGSLAALTAEIHELRVAVEDSTRTQSQTQALAAYLSVQKDRIFQVASRLDALRKDLDTAISEARQFASRASDLEAQLARAPSQEMRDQILDQAAELKRLLATSTDKAQTLRSREAELAQSLQVEEARWADLISRLEQVIRRQ